MAKALKVEAQPREMGGSSQSRRLRRGGALPGIVYGEGKEGLRIQLDEHTFTKALKNHEGEHLLMDLDVAGQGTKKVLLQEIQHNHLTGKIIHVDFHEIALNKKLRVKVPLRLMGEPVGVTQQGGVLEYLVREIEIECLPTDIPEHLDVDVSGLSISQRITAGDIKSTDGKFTVTTSKDIAVAAVTAPREEEAAATPEAAAAAGAAEPEVLREKKEEGEEGAADGKAGAKDAKAAPAKDAKAPAGKEAAKPAAGGKEAKK
jgi:large subunit ribosomal protein L25